MKKTRLDQLLTARGLFESREQARRAVMAGEIQIDQQIVSKPGTLVDPEAEIVRRGRPIPYASRGGLKLEKALEAFALDPIGAVALDAGASTGGFTDCLLQHGAKRVYAVDVGYGQLAWKLRSDDRVVALERTNIRYVKPEQFPELMDLITIDVSFISLSKVFPAVLPLLKTAGDMAILIKPQFEVGREQVGKQGVVRDLGLHTSMLNELIPVLQDCGSCLIQLCPSPIRGPKGNVEYLAYFRKQQPGATAECIREWVAKATAEVREQTHSR